MIIEVNVFRSFTARMMNVKRKFNETYDGEIYLMNRFLTAADIPSIQNTLKDRVSRTVHQLTSLVSNRLYEKPHTTC